VIRAVIDTNVFVSALISSSGNEALIVLGIQHGLIKPYFSAEILTEYAEVLARPKFAFPPDEIKSLLALLQSRGEEVFNTQPLSSSSPDPTDEKFLACARAAAVDYIVTGNKRHFPAQTCTPIQVVNAGELLDRITFEI
jgi:uncharacterized protein